MKFWERENIKTYKSKPFSVEKVLIPKDHNWFDIIESPAGVSVGKKYCTGCQKWKIMSDFPSNRTTKEGKNALCRYCNRKRDRIYNERTGNEKRKQTIKEKTKIFPAYRMQRSIRHRTNKALIHFVNSGHLTKGQEADIKLFT